MPDTGVVEAMENASLAFGSSLIAPGYRALPLPENAPVPEVLENVDCICYVEKLPEEMDLDVACQSVCQRIGDPDTVDVVLMLRGQGTFDWDDTNSGFSVDGGTNYYALDPNTGDPLQSPLTSLVVDQEYIYTMVLDMSAHIDDFLTGQDQVDYLISFTVS